jgi:hypothetical protein
MGLDRARDLGAFLRDTSSIALVTGDAGPNTIYRSEPIRPPLTGLLTLLLTTVCQDSLFKAILKE